MGIKFKTKESLIDDEILQGDIFKNVSYIYKSNDNDEFVDITEFEFPYIVVLSQSCDVSAMSKMIKNGGKSLKFMPSILVAPIYDKETLKTGEVLDEIIENSSFDIQKENLFNSSAYSIISNDDHYRFQTLDFEEKNPIDFDKPMIDFKHYFTVSAEYLNNVRDRRICHLEQLYCEQITLRFSNFLSRIAFPD